MAESEQERSEEPTGKRLSDAREKGQVARSKELGTAAVLIFATISLIVFGGDLAAALIQVFKQGFSLEREQVFSLAALFEKIRNMLWQLAFPLGVILSIIAAAAVVGNILLGGFSFSWKAAAPKWSKMSPLQGFKRMFGIQALVELVKSIAKVLVIGGFVYGILIFKFESILNLSVQQLPGSAFNALDMLKWMLLALVCSLIFIALIDIPYQIWNHKKQLKMTKQEVKDEHKDTDGNPEQKGRIRQLQYEMANRRMMADVPQADVIITNPEHYAIALRYDSKQGDAPILVAKGVDQMAMKIREIARHYEIPIIASPPLARAIYHHTEIGKEIPDGLYAAVAQVLAYVYQLSQYRLGRSSRPKPINPEPPIPEDLRS